jgi:hypothetical protein
MKNATVSWTSFNLNMVEFDDVDMEKVLNDSNIFSASLYLSGFSSMFFSILLNLLLVQLRFGHHFHTAKNNTGVTVLKG